LFFWCGWQTYSILTQEVFCLKLKLIDSTGIAGGFGSLKLQEKSTGVAGGISDAP